MPSLKYYLLPWIVWWFLGSSTKSAEAFRKSIQDDRKNPDTSPPKDLRKKFSIDQREYNGSTVYEVSPKSEHPTKAHILYLPGGGLVFKALEVHWTIVSKLAERLQATVTMPMYPLAPEHKITEVYDVLRPLHKELARAALGENVPYWIMGDSAGGLLALSLTQQAIANGEPTASKMILITPAIDMSFENPESRRVAVENDPWMDIAGLLEIAKLSAPDLDPKDPLISPVYGSAEKLPETLLFVATRDLWSPDAILFAQKAKEAGRRIEVVRGEGMLHAWPLLPFYEGGLEVDRIVQWLGQTERSDL